jgi:hypothetical protein
VHKSRSSQGPPQGIGAGAVSVGLGVGAGVKVGANEGPSPAMLVSCCKSLVNHGPSSDR